MKKAIFYMTLIALSNSESLFAFEGSYNQSLNNEVISIDGQYTEKRHSQADKLKSLRKKLEKRTEEVVQQKIEQLRYQQELELTKKIQKTFQQRMDSLDQAFNDNSDSRYSQL